MFIPSCLQLACTESSFVFQSSQIVTPGEMIWECANVIYLAGGVIFSSQLTERRRTGMCCNNKQIKKEHDTLASA